MAEEETATVAENTDAAPAEEVPAETAEKPESEEVTAEKPDAESEAAPETKPKKPDKSQKKIADLAYRERELRRQNAQLTKALEAQATKAKSDVKAPQLENYDTFEEYLDARDSHRDAQRETTKAPEPEQNDDFYIARDDMIQNGAEKYEDFVDVVTADNVKITEVMASALLEIDDTDLQVDAAYFLGNNPKEAARIAKLPPVRQVAEVAKLEMKLSTKAKPAKRPSAAPEPIKPVGGAKTSPTELVEGESYESFLKKRNKQLGR
jgi:hypothetical protein